MTIQWASGGLVLDHREISNSIDQGGQVGLIGSHGPLRGSIVN